MENYLKVRDVYRKTTVLATSSVNRSNSDRSGLRGENYKTDETVLQYISAKSTIVLRLVSRHAVKTSLYDLSGCILTKKVKKKVLPLSTMIIKRNFSDTMKQMADC